ncbi:MAG: NUDIX hydrolase [Acidimicrobiales bacterium]
MCSPFDEVLGVLVVQAVDAATVMMISRRDDGQLEVLMQRRNVNLEFVGGAYVFPGGKVDDADRLVVWESLGDGLDDARASTILAVPSGGLGLYVAALRESFEEAGVLLAASGGETPYGRAALEEYRGQLLRNEVEFVDLIRSMNVRLAFSRLHYFAHWITPEGSPRRYDTRFFLAEVPRDAVGIPQEREATESIWIRPEEALARYREKEFELILPTVKNLEALARFRSYDVAIDSVRRVTEVPTIQPKLVRDSEGVRIVLPFDPEFDEAEEAFLGSDERLPLTPPPHVE